MPAERQIIAGDSYNLLMKNCIVLTTVPNVSVAEQLAVGLVEQSLAACVNILPAMQSIYYWQGQLQQEAEHQLIIKTTESAYKDIEKFIKNTHPYTLPEIIALPIQSGSEDYLNWVTQNSEKKSCS